MLRPTPVVIRVDTSVRRIYHIGTRLTARNAKLLTIVVPQAVARSSVMLFYTTLGRGAGLKSGKHPVNNSEHS